MKNAIIISSLVVLAFSPVIAYGALSSDCVNGTSSTGLCNPIRYSQDDIGIFLLKVVSIFTGFFAITALVMVVFSGFRMVISQGEPESLTTAKDSLKWSISGLILSLFAFVIVTAIGNYIGMKNIPPGSYVGNNNVLNPLSADTFLGLVATMLQGFLAVTGILSILMIVISGFKYITSSGNEEQAEGAKKSLQWAIIGLVVILLSYVLVRATLTFFNP